MHNAEWSANLSTTKIKVNKNGVNYILAEKGYVLFSHKDVLNGEQTYCIHVSSGDAREALAELMTPEFLKEKSKDFKPETY